jgi:hypothetical protein
MKPVEWFVASAVTLAVWPCVSLGQPPPTQGSVNCASGIEKPAYPRLARIANISGSVAAHVAVGASGKADGVRLEGHPLLAKEIDVAIRRTDFPAGCQSENLDVTFIFRLEGDPSDEAKASTVFNAPDQYIVTSNPTGIICILRADVKKVSKERRSLNNPINTTAPRFSDYPASSALHGSIAAPKFNRKSDEGYQTALTEAMKTGPNFAAHYVLAKFQYGNGPVGAMVVDARSGSVFHLPPQVIQEDFFIYDTDCLALTKKWCASAAEEDDDASALSFLPSSELLIVRRCLAGTEVNGVEKSYFRWHGNRWTLLKRAVLPPPPPLPVQ